MRNIKEQIYDYDELEIWFFNNDTSRRETPNPEIAYYFEVRHKNGDFCQHQVHKMEMIFDYLEDGKPKVKVTYEDDPFYKGEHLTRNDILGCGEMGSGWIRLTEKGEDEVIKQEIDDILGENENREDNR